MGLGDRIGRLEDDGGPQRCASCPYASAPRHLVATRYINAAGEEVGYEPDPRDTGPPEICGECPYRAAPGGAPPHTIVVVRAVIVEGSVP